MIQDYELNLAEYFLKANYYNTTIAEIKNNSDIMNYEKFDGKDWI